MVIKSGWQLAGLLGCSLLLAQRTAYCLRMIKIVEPAGNSVAVVEFVTW